MKGSERIGMMKIGERISPMEISENELWILSYYRASELGGALVMARLAQETDDDDLRVHLTEHCAEEANHAWLWTQTILEVGGTPFRVSETYQSRYYAEIGRPRTVLEVLALTQVFERRVLRHFRNHLARPDTHPAVAATLRRMIADEAGHIGWVKKRLDRYARENGEGLVAEVIQRFAEVDCRVYAELLEYRDRLGELVDPVRKPGPSPPEEPVPAAGNGGRPDRSRLAVERRIIEVAARSVGLRPEDLDPSTSLSLVGVDSLGLVTLISAIEEDFRIEFSPEDTAKLYTFDDLFGKVAELAGLGRFPACRFRG